MMRENASLRRAGFTLVDVIVAVVVLAVGILGLSATAGVVAAHMRVAQADTELRARAQAEMESLLAGGYRRLASGESRRGGYRVSWEVSGVDPKQVRLVVERRVGREPVADTLVTMVHAP